MTFVYVEESPTKAEYKVEFYFDKDGNGEYLIDDDRTLMLSGDVGSKVTLSEQQMPEIIDGCKLKPEMGTIEGTITSMPTLVLKVYYEKIKTPAEPTEPAKPTPTQDQNKPGTSKRPERADVIRTGENLGPQIMGLALLACTAGLVVIVSNKKKDKSQ